MISEISTYKNICEQLKSNENRILELGILQKENFEKFHADIEQKLNNFKPSLMVYGCYNAGKSTLINALFGKEVAKTSDVPETDRVSEYIYNNFSIYDTPGINAPIQHEEVTNEHLAKSEIIIFVISNDSGFEESYIYDKLKNIFLAKKPVIIVLNNKSSFAKNSEELNEQLKRIEINVKKLNLDECFYKIVALNAKLAFEGKIVDQNELLDISNLTALENILADILKNSSETEVINTLNLYIESFLKNLLHLLDENNPDKEIADIQKLLTSTIEQKRSAKIKARVLAEEYFSSIKEEIESCIEVNGDLNSLIDLKFKEFFYKLQSLFEDIQTDFGNNLSNFSLSKLEFSDINYDFSSKNTADFLMDKAVKLLDNSLAKKQLQEKTQQATEFILKKTKEYLPSLMKGKGSAWIGKVAGKAGGCVAIATNAISILYNRHKEIQESEQAFQAERRAKQANANMANNTVLELIIIANKNTDDTLDELFNPMIKDFEASLKLKEVKNNDIATLKNSINGLFSQLPIKQ